MAIDPNKVPEQAVILAAGMGSRLRPLTDARPKPLVEVHGIPILHNALQNLAAIGVKETTLVTGYRKDDVIVSCGEAIDGMMINYVESTVFDRTGSAYSLWLARHALLHGDVLLLEGDVFFEPAILDRLLSLEGNTAALDVFDELMSGSAVVMSDALRIREWHMNQTIKDAAASTLYKTINLFRFDGQTLRQHLVPRLDDIVSSGGAKFYVEQLLASLIADGKLDIRGTICSDLKWYEIDSMKDLRVAERIFRRPQPFVAAQSVGGAF